MCHASFITDLNGQNRLKRNPLTLNAGGGMYSGAIIIFLWAVALDNPPKQDHTYNTNKSFAVQYSVSKNKH
jgi:hypothetical protein